MRNNKCLNRVKAFMMIMVLSFTAVWSAGCGSNTATSEQKPTDNAASADKSSEIVEIPDPVLKKTIQDALEIGDREITKADALSLTGISYDCYGNTDQRIQDITGLSEFKNLTHLYLYNNQISDISALSGLTNLETLNLSYNQIDDISALSGLENLTELELLPLLRNR